MPFSLTPDFCGTNSRCLDLIQFETFWSAVLSFRMNVSSVLAVITNVTTSANRCHLLEQIFLESSIYKILLDVWSRIKHQLFPTSSTADWCFSYAKHGRFTALKHNWMHFWQLTQCADPFIHLSINLKKLLNRSGKSRPPDLQTKVCTPACLGRILLLGQSGFTALSYCPMPSKSLNGVKTSIKARYGVVLNSIGDDVVCAIMNCPKSNLS